MIFERAQSNANVATLIERVNRFAVVPKNPDRQSKPVMERLIESL
ncbi:hypothetical protein IMCC21224_1244 [Puniceibacterium sp. IMCC21224]|nr:hypothetical protein IMCC21224_1244 [Puniceibacterium sp. IMCC21224]